MHDTCKHQVSSFVQLLQLFTVLKENERPILIGYPREWKGFASLGTQRGGTWRQDSVQGFDDGRYKLTSSVAKAVNCSLGLS